jgi:hypothetical protein
LEKGGILKTAGIGAVYHWFDEPEDSPPYSNLRVPIIVSIATLRAVNPSIPILVLTDEERDWKHFPEKLNFEVRRIEFTLKHKNIKGCRHLSRIFDLQQFPDNPNIMYVDSDVFWFRDPLPLSQSLDKFCFNGWNTGFFYYNRNLNLKFFDIFSAYAKAAIYSEDVRKVMRKYVGYDSWHVVWDEMITTYMKRHHPELFHTIPLEEHATAKIINELDLGKVKMLHCNGIMADNARPKNPAEKNHSRGLLGILVSEFYDKMIEVLGKEDLRQIYSEEELSYYLPHQFSLLENPNYLSKTQSAQGHFHIQKCLRQRVI